MGSAVQALAAARGHDIVAAFNSRVPLDTAGGPEILRSADVAVDFSLPSVVTAHLHAYCRWRQPAVVGTTGWTQSLNEVRRLAAECEASLLIAPNFSLGIQLVKMAVNGLGPLLDALPEYDVALTESHHIGKADRPSGTALMLADLLAAHLERKKTVGPATGLPDPAMLEIAALRVGNVFGEHSITIDSLFDQISLTHTARNRKGFALGALKAAEWLPGRTGLFTLDDALADWLDQPTIHQTRNAQ